MLGDNPCQSTQFGTYFENPLINCSKVGTYVSVDKINKVINCVLGV